jgi:hypothetical protein
MGESASYICERLRLTKLSDLQLHTKRNDFQQEGGYQLALLVRVETTQMTVVSLTQMGAIRKGVAKDVDLGVSTFFFVLILVAHFYIRCLIV